MKLPKLFRPEKSLEDKTKQLLHPVERIPDPILYEKELALDEIILGLEQPRSKRNEELYKKIEGALLNEGYSRFTAKNANPAVQPWNILHGFWTKREGSSTRVISRHVTIKEGEYTFAKIGTENIDEFCFRLAKNKAGELSKSLGNYHNRREYLKGFIPALFVSSAYTAYEMLPILEGVITSPLLLVLSAAAAGLACGGMVGMLYDEVAHRVNEERMKDLCHVFTINEKEAIRLAMY